MTEIHYSAPPIPAAEETVFRDPMGSFFDPFHDSAAAEALAVFHSREQRQLLEIGQSDELVMHALEVGGLIPAMPAKPGKDASAEERHQYDQAQARAQHARSPIRELISTASEYYRSDYWENYDRREGQDLDRLGDLYNRAESFEAQSSIHELFKKICTQNPMEHQAVDALRIIKILLVNEREPIERDLP